MFYTKQAHEECLQADKHTDHVVSLKVLTASNINEFMRWATDDEVTKYMMWSSYSSVKEAEIFFANVVDKHSWFKAICLNDKVIGSITLDKGKGIHNCKAELGYVLAKSFWGKGYGTLAINLAIQMGFKDLEVQRIEAYVDPVNIGSQRVLEKNGFKKEGLLSKCVIQKGIVKDRFIYALLKSCKIGLV